MTRNSRIRLAARAVNRKVEIHGRRSACGGSHAAGVMGIPDSETAVPVTATRVRDGNVLDDWLSKGKISRQLWNGGSEFRRQFYRAGLGERFATVGFGGGGGGNAEAFAELIHGDTLARQGLDRAFRALGPAQSDIAWLVLGEEFSLRRYAERSRARKMPMTADRAAGLLLGTLETLAIHYGRWERGPS